MYLWRLYHCTGVGVMVAHNRLAVETGSFPLLKKSKCDYIHKYIINL
jgi:hypothetical protein